MTSWLVELLRVMSLFELPLSQLERSDAFYSFNRRVFLSVLLCSAPCLTLSAMPPAVSLQLVPYEFSNVLSHLFLSYVMHPSFFPSLFHVLLWLLFGSVLCGSFFLALLCLALLDFTFAGRHVLYDTARCRCLAFASYRSCYALLLHSFFPFALELNCHCVTYCATLCSSLSFYSCLFMLYFISFRC